MILMLKYNSAVFNFSLSLPLCVTVGVCVKRRTGQTLFLLNKESTVCPSLSLFTSVSIALVPQVYRASSHVSSGGYLLPTGSVGLAC